MNKVQSFKNIIQELKKLDLDKNQRRSFIESISQTRDDTFYQVQDLLSLRGMNKILLDNLWIEHLDQGELNFDECLDIQDVVIVFKEFLEARFENLEIDSIKYHDPKSNYDYVSWKRLIGDFHELESQWISLDFIWNDSGKQVCNIRFYIPGETHSYIDIPIKQKQDSNNLDTNLDLWKLKNIYEKGNLEALLQSSIHWVVAAYSDKLTGLYNGYYAEGLLERQEHNRSMIFIDIARFKQINDKFGQNIWDEVIQALWKFLQSKVRSNDKVVRLGGDEFAILFSNWDKKTKKEIEDGVEIFKSRLLEDPIDYQSGDNNIPIELSIWYSTSTLEENKSKEDLVLESNLMMIENKSSQWAVYRLVSALNEASDEVRLNTYAQIMRKPNSREFFFASMLKPEASRYFFPVLIELFSQEVFDQMPQEVQRDILDALEEIKKIDLIKK